MTASRQRGVDVATGIGYLLRMALGAPGPSVLGAFRLRGPTDRG